MTIDQTPTYGRATIDPADDIIAGSMGTWTITYTVGYHGMDDSARILIARRLASNSTAKRNPGPFSLTPSVQRKPAETAPARWFTCRMKCRPPM